MNLLKSMHLFVEVAHLGNVARAGEALGLSAPSASRLLKDLEDWVGAPLVRRTTRHLSLTELGERYLPRCTEILRQTNALRDEVQEASDTPQGLLRVTAAGIFARSLLTPVLPDFLARYPKVKLDVVATDRRVDIMAENFDLALRVGSLDDSDLVARRICSARAVLVGAPAYLARAGRPQSPADLAGHACLIDTVPEYGAQWPFLNGARVTGPVQINDAELIRDLARAGLGLALIPEIMVRDDLAHGTLEALLPEQTARAVDISAVYPKRAYIKPAARALVAQLQEVLQMS